MSTIGNILWFILGGVLMGLSWWFVGLIMCLLVVTIPFARACFVIGKFSFFPFGKEAVSRKDVTGSGDIGTGMLGLAGNIIWFLLGGVWLAIGHVLHGALLFVTIIGIPFGIQHFKLAQLALAPIGKTIVKK